MILGSTARLSSGMMQWGSRGPFRERGIGRFNRASGWWVAAFHKAARALPERLREGSGPFSEPPSSVCRGFRYRNERSGGASGLPSAGTA